MQAAEVGNRVYKSNHKSLEWGLDTAMRALRPNAKFELEMNDNSVKWNKWEDLDGKSPPTFEQIMAEIERQELVSKYYQYAYDRCHNYPDGFEQLDMLWHAIDQGIDLKESDWYKKIKEVKEKFPKPDGDPPPEFQPED